MERAHGHDPTLVGSSPASSDLAGAQADWSAQGSSVVGSDVDDRELGAAAERFHRDDAMLALGTNHQADLARPSLLAADGTPDPPFEVEVATALQHIAVGHHLLPVELEDVLR